MNICLTLKSGEIRYSNSLWIDDRSIIFHTITHLLCHLIKQYQWIITKRNEFNSQMTEFSSFYNCFFSQNIFTTIIICYFCFSLHFTFQISLKYPALHFPSPYYHRSIHKRTKIRKTQMMVQRWVLFNVYVHHTRFSFSIRPILVARSYDLYKH